jgi:hypothetical protein
MTWLGYLNFGVLQWLCVRLARERDDAGNIVGYRWLGPVAPLTGWWNDYVWLTRGKHE